MEEDGYLGGKKKSHGGGAKIVRGETGTEKEKEEETREKRNLERGVGRRGGGSSSISTATQSGSDNLKKRDVRKSKIA